ncbi:hypothetical protein KP77_28780 [Jeotgalibacillus alimentarius]|uniref:HTH cro/C1-type domain-containing protein n=1 Tax=Jeotgalibacillus alimentarius TaxID=135826 RepID=A0A0C2V6R5_9BACL|nr:helix-turn-helix transcriptional regulator [Jeotgalibacillus alimentarius]KIL44657.1 hypothetical protein KP77_28780 [Jeotgalibacillus alimentarius]
MNVGSIIKYYRTKKGMTQTELAEGICSISHLSKIETNMYSANEETVGLLLDKLGLKLDEIADNLAELKEILQEFISSVFMRDTATIDTLFEEMMQKEDYFETSEYVNLFHLYKYRYFLNKADLKEAQVQMKILQRLKTTFDPIESNILTFFNGFHYTITEKTEEAIKALNKFLENPLPVGGQWVGEAYYLLARAHVSMNQNEAGLIFSKKAYDIFMNESNFSRQVHSQTIIGISYMRLNLYNEAIAIYKPLLQNTRMFFRDSLYAGVLVNYGRCLHMSKQYGKAQKYLDEALELAEPYTESHAVGLLIWLENVQKNRKVNKQWHSRVQLLKESYKETYGKYYYHYSTYLEKLEFSQLEGVKYAVKWLYPYLVKHQNYGDAREIIEVIIDYYNDIGDFTKTKEFYDQWRLLIEKERIYYG